jgi:hypothetical protein
MQHSDMTGDQRNNRVIPIELTKILAHLASYNWLYGITVHSKLVGFIGTAALGILLYLLFITVNYDPNGITEAFSVELGGAQLFNPHHMLNRPLGLLFYEITTRLGYNWRSLVILQWISAASGIIGLSLAHIAFHNLARSLRVSCIFALWLGTSWAYWSTATDVSYLIPSAMLLAAIISWLTKSKLSYLDFAGIGLVYSISLLSCQCNVAFMPALLLASLMSCRQTAWRNRLVVMAIVGISSMTPAALVYWSIGTFLYGYTTIQEFLQWTIHYADQLPMYGQPTPNSLITLITTDAGSFIPIQSGLGFRRLLHGYIDVINISRTPSIIAICLLYATPIYYAMKHWGKFVCYIKRYAWIALGYISYIIFIAWWEPGSVVWFVLPNLLLLAFIAGWLKTVTQSRRIWAMYGTCIAVIAAINFSATIWPNRVEASHAWLSTRCIASHLKYGDLFIQTDWEAANYLEYFYGHQVVSVIYEAAHTHNKEGARRSVEYRMVAANRMGNHVYMKDVMAYPSDHKAWLEQQTGFTIDDFTAWGGDPAFACAGDTYLRIE